jgi:anhydro-N-acetylmuramic acid kinase
MIVAGVMSGTSADGINVALIRISEQPAGTSKRPAHRTELKIKLLAHGEYAYPPNIRKAVLATMNATRASVADLARLNFALGELYSEAVMATQRKLKLKAELVGCHGQTIYHQGEGSPFLGRKIATTWQTGEGSVIAARVGVPVISDFRPADIAAGGKGAPLVPFLDYLLYRDAHLGRIVQNIGGIANLTAIPANVAPERVFAFDTGPGNMVIDGVTEMLLNKKFDRNGELAASGTVIERVVSKLLHASYFRRKPPKTAGREEFGREFTKEFIRLCGRASKQDVIATATALAARSIADAIQRFVLPRGSFRELIVSGGGAKNPTLMAMLANAIQPLGITLRSSDEIGIPSEAKEAVAFAVLAYETWHRRPSNMPSATGAKCPAILGKISYA